VEKETENTMSYIDKKTCSIGLVWDAKFFMLHAFSNSSRRTTMQEMKGCKMN
jgi:hypothetical protein